MIDKPINSGSSKSGFIYEPAQDEPPLDIPADKLDAILEKLYEVELLDYTEHLRLQGQVGTSAAKSLFLLNGGAIAGILTFIGNKGADIAGSEMRLAIYFFVAGLVLSAGAPLAGYLAQVDFQQAARRQMLDFLRIHSGNAQAGNRSTLEDKGYKRLSWGVVCCIASLALFSLGAIIAVKSLQLADGATQALIGG